jgi:hypothetical protein
MYVTEWYHAYSSANGMVAIILVPMSERMDGGSMRAGCAEAALEQKETRVL